MRFSVLASSSKANSTFIEIGGKRLLVDCGLSSKQTGERLLSLGISPESIDAIFVTHEHRDHINGASVFSRKYKVPVFCNAETSRFISNVHSLEIFFTGKEIDFAGIKINPFGVVHDAVDPVAFSFSDTEYKLSYLTDSGRVTSLILDSVKDSNVMILESNHDTEELQCCDYPWELKQRIASSHGHLSNDESLRIVSEVYNRNLSHLVLMHLSENSNNENLVLDTFSEYLDKMHVSCAKAVSPTPLFSLEREQYKIAI